jgi:hypothetical protein
VTQLFLKKELVALKLARNSAPFMESEDSKHSKELATVFYPEPNEFSPNNNCLRSSLFLIFSVLLLLPPSYVQKFHSATPVSKTLL